VILVIPIGSVDQHHYRPPLEPLQHLVQRIARSVANDIRREAPPAKEIFHVARVNGWCRLPMWPGGMQSKRTNELPVIREWSNIGVLEQHARGRDAAPCIGAGPVALGHEFNGVVSHVMATREAARRVRARCRGS